MCCPICKRETKDTSFRKRLPVSSATLQKEGDLPAEIVPFLLSFCSYCDFYYNSQFDAQRVQGQYSSENYSLKKILPGSMSKNVKNILNNVVVHCEKLDVSIEVGCGRGDFALALATRFSEVFTVDPSVESASLSGVTHINEFFTADVFNRFPKPDLIVARHLLEHLHDPVKFIDDVSRLADESSAIVYIEIPNFKEIIESKRFYDIFNDHFGYYLPSTFIELVAKSNLRVIEHFDIFGGQHIGYICKYDDSVGASNVECLHDLVCLDGLEEQRVKLATRLSAYNSIIIWGAGAHGLTLYSLLDDASQAKVKFFIDNDGAKQGKYIPGTAITVRSKDGLSQSNFDCVVVSASLYEAEIEEAIRKSTPGADVIIPTRL